MREMSDHVGHKAAMQATGDPKGETVSDNRVFPAMPFYRGNPWFPTVVVACYRFHDACGRTRRNGESNAPCLKSPSSSNST